MAEELNRLKRIKSLLQDTKLIDSHTISAVVAECDAVIFAQRPAAQTEREAWVPYLVDRADGVKGHYAIGRWNPRGYREVWNLHSHRWAAYSDDVMSLEEADSLLRQITIPTVRASLPTQPAAQEVDDGDVTGQPGPLPETGWDEVPEGAFRKPSPTAGMNLGERIKHVGGRENAAGYIEFGSVAAVRALVRQYLRDLPAPQQATPEPVGGHDMAVMLERGAKAWAGVDPQDLRAGGTPEPTVTYATVRDAEDELHIECRFSDGQKFAAVTVAQGFDNLAHRIETMLNGAQQATPEPVLFNGLTEAETNATASVSGLTATPPQQAAGEPVGRCLTEEEQARTTLRDPVVWFGGAPRGKTLYTHPAPGVSEGAREALERIASWNEHPAMLGVDYGSNGVRDYYRKIARDALAAAQAKGGEQ